MTTDEPTAALTASGGWCAPGTTGYGLDAPAHLIFPEVSVSRGGLQYVDLTPEQRIANAALRDLAARAVEHVTQARTEAIEEACRYALATGCDVHLYYHPDYGWTGSFRDDPETWTITGRVGIAFRPARFAIPTIVEHHGIDATADDDVHWSTP